MGRDITRKDQVKETSLTAQRIRDRRKEIGMTQAQLAEKVGVCYGSVSRWETSVRPNLRPQDIAKIAEALSCDANFLTGTVAKSDNEVENSLFKIISKMSKIEQSELLRYCLSAYPERAE